MTEITIKRTTREKLAINEMIKHADFVGYGNLISCLQMAWALKILKNNDMPNAFCERPFMASKYLWGQIKDKSPKDAISLIESYLGF